MARKKIDIDPRIDNDRVGLMITRGQIEHFGHTALKAQMMLDNGRNIIGFGSSQKHGVFDNPLTSDQKKRAQQGAWGDVFSIVFLQDIGATDRSTDWADYVFDRIRTHQLPEPTDFYAGSIHEARWYENHFTSMKGSPAYTRGLFHVWEDEATSRRIHILDRKDLGFSSSRVRTLIERRDPAWRDFVPAKLWDFYEWEYPPELRNAILLPDHPDDWPGLDVWPAGTKGMLFWPAGTKGLAFDVHEVFILRDDGIWRPRTEIDREEYFKSLGD